MTWNAGILIAGSLWWDDEKPHRKRWREQLLQRDGTVAVKAPIRYGRWSKTRGGTYTMVYAPGVPVGQAKAVPCRTKIAKFEDIVAEAEELWMAEQSEPKEDRRLSADWGCVALLRNPHSDLPDQLLNAWAGRIQKEHYKPSEHKGAVNERGLLQIQWPDRPDNGEPLDGLDLLLATATVPRRDKNTHGFPSVTEIAEAWNKKPKEANYFHKNREHSIRTFQDNEILSQLKGEAAQP